MSTKTPESIIIRAIHEAFIKYPEGDGGPNLDYQWVQPEQSAHVAKAILLELAANGMIPAAPNSTNGSTGSHQAGGYVVRSRTALLSAMLIGNRRTATIESALRIAGSMFPTRP